jgi:hypothetical protein
LGIDAIPFTYPRHAARSRCTTDHALNKLNSNPRTLVPVFFNASIVRSRRIGFPFQVHVVKRHLFLEGPSSLVIGCFRKLLSDGECHPLQEPANVGQPDVILCRIRIRQVYVPPRLVSRLPFRRKSTT